MPTIETVTTEADVDCSLEIELVCQCPVRAEMDRYAVIVEWNTSSSTYEKHALKKQMKTHSDREVTQEQLCEDIFSDLSGCGVAGLSVTVVDEEHMDMVVSKNV